MANWEPSEQQRDRAAAIAFSEQVLSDRRDSAWLSGLPTPSPAPNADGCVITYLGHITPDDDEADQWCETHHVKFAPGEKCPGAEAETPIEDGQIPSNAVTVTPHAGQIVYHCRRCDTRVAVSVEELAGRDITKLCLCGQGTLTRENGDRSISQAWPVKPRQPEPTDPVIDARIAKAKHKRTEWEEEI